MYIYIVNKWLICFRRYKNIRKMDSTYITKCRYKGPASQPANQSASHVTHVRDRQNNFSHSASLSVLDIPDRLISASQPVRLSVLDRPDRLTSASHSVCLSLTDRMTSARKSVCLYLTDRLSDSQIVWLSDRQTFINDLFRIRKYKNIRKIDSTYITE